MLLCVARPGERDRHHGDRGPPSPLIVDADGNGVTESLPVGLPLGVDAQARYEQSEVQVVAGSVMALFTDGLLDGRLLGSEAAMERLGRVLADHCGDNLEVLADRLVQDRRGWRVLADDAALLLVRYEGAQSREHRRVARMSVQRHHLQGVAQVREFLRDLLHQWDMLPMLDTLELLTSEVVTNALIHADSEVELRLRSTRTGSGSRSVTATRIHPCPPRSSRTRRTTRKRSPGAAC